jgi:cyclic pyranopterin phosphate synthase
LLKGVNDKEEDFDKWAEFIKTNEVDFRYIELMQTGDNLDYFNKYHVPSSKFVNYLNERNWIFKHLEKMLVHLKIISTQIIKVKFGVIAPYSKDFCKAVTV